MMSKTPMGFKVTPGFYVPGVLAAVARPRSDASKPQAKTLRRIAYIQRQVSWKCPRCGRRSCVDFLPRLRPEVLYKLATRLSHRSLLNEVERRYRHIALTCPKRGLHGGRLPLYV